MTNRGSQVTHPNDKVVLLTGDAGLHLMAEAEDVEIVEPPPQWVTTEEDPKERQIKDLESKLKELRSQRADLVLSASINPIHEAPREDSEWNVGDGPAKLTQPQAAELAKKTRERLMRNWRLMPLGSSARELPKEKLDELDEFEAEYSQYLIAKSEYEVDIQSYVRLFPLVENKGGASAEHVDVFLEMLSGGEFVKETDLPVRPKEPKTPDPPKNYFSQVAEMMRSLQVGPSVLPSLLAPRAPSPAPNVVGPHLEDSRKQARYNIQLVKHSMVYELEGVIVRRHDPSKSVVIKCSILGAGPGEKAETIIRIDPEA